MYALQSYESRFRKYLEAVYENISTEERENLRKQLKIDRIMDDIKPLIEGSLEGSERVKTIVEELRRFATPKNNKITEFDLVELINNSIHWVTHSARKKPKLITATPDELFITANEGYIHQILINLLQNALDALENITQAFLIVTIKEDVNTATLTIQDNGVGIPEENLVKLFDPFFTTKPIGKGTGLGLYISYGLATEQCNGSLHVENHENGGAIFTLSLPKAVAYV